MNKDNMSCFWYDGYHSGK